MSPAAGYDEAADQPRASGTPAFSGAIDRDSPVPFHHQLKALLRAEIDSGRWLAGTRIPSEPELCRAFDVSRTVVRQALGALEQERLLKRRKGLGTFVAEAKLRGRLVQTLTGFHDDMTAQGRAPRTQVLEQRLVPADPTVAEALGLDEGELVVRLERLRSVDGEPIVLVTAFVPAALAPGLEAVDLTDASLYETLGSRFGLHIEYGRRLFEAQSASEEEAERLGIEPGDPLLYLRSTTFLADGRAVEYHQALHRGDRTLLEVDLLREREGEPLPGRASEAEVAT
jgi:GntR family transcriptional regulator